MLFTLKGWRYTTNKKKLEVLEKMKLKQIGKNKELPLLQDLSKFT